MWKPPQYSEFQLDSFSQSRRNFANAPNQNEPTASTHLPFREVHEDLEIKYIGTKRPSYLRTSTGKSHEPLLSKDNDDDDEDIGGSESRSPVPSNGTQDFSGSSSLRSMSPDKFTELEIKTKYKYAAFFLGLTLITFVVQTETAVYIQHELGWNKAYSMLYLTHGSWFLLWPLQLFVSRTQQWDIPWKDFLRKNIELLRTTAQMVETHQLIIPRTQHSPVPYLIRTTTIITFALTIAGGSWYIAVNLTSPSDLTAIYNCSAFFAYAFSIPILGEKLRWDKVLAVILAIIGVLVVSYGDYVPIKQVSKSSGAVGGENMAGSEAKNRFAGNLIIGVGSLLYGFYEVLYKRLACPPEGTSARRSIIFANAFGSLIGFFTLSFLWIPIPILHFTGLEIFELPHGEAALLLGISVLSNAIFSGSFLSLISLTSPVLSSVAALLTIFLVAIVDWLWTGVPLSLDAVAGGILIIIAFAILSWGTYCEMSAMNL
ncbi:putative duf6 domain protein [Erysiphe neolycopersici]|uniref:Putative duf6 domain protein n=1 Tax=Erysiphe neolycopersici TaxID=212602 RepID=A0A420I165_9PEZI|nr:putative duf6 domain protein [Erysiphe neolycopersici]